MSPPPKKPQVPPPPGKPLKQRFMTHVPTLEQTPENLTKPAETGFQDLNFKVSPDFHRLFKTTAVMRGMSMKELLEAAFNHYVQSFPTRQDDLFRK